jgi:hypothetical protein
MDFARSEPAAARKLTKRQAYEAAVEAVKAYGTADAKLLAVSMAAKADLSRSAYQLFLTILAKAGRSHSLLIDARDLAAELKLTPRQLEVLVSKLRGASCVLAYRFSSRPSSDGTAFTFPVPFDKLLTHEQETGGSLIAHPRAGNAQTAHPRAENAQTAHPRAGNAEQAQNTPTAYIVSMGVDSSHGDSRIPDDSLNSKESKLVSDALRPLSDLRLIGIVADDGVTVTKARISTIVPQPAPKPAATFAADVSLIRQIAFDTGVTEIEAAQRLADVLAAWSHEAKRFSPNWRKDLGERARREITADQRAKAEPVSTAQTELFPGAESWLTIRQAGITMRLTWRSRTGETGEAVRFLPRLALTNLAARVGVSRTAAARLVMAVVEGWRARSYAGRKDSWERDLLEEAVALHHKLEAPAEAEPAAYALPPTFVEGVTPGPVPDHLARPEFDEFLRNWLEA